MNVQCAEKILICTHGKFGEELKRSAEMIAGSMDKVETFSLLPGMDPEIYAGEIKNALENCPAAICLVDLIGGTPFNVTLQLSATYPITVLTGLNMTMLLQTYEDMDEVSYEDLPGQVMNEFHDSGKIISLRGAPT
ncbi:PTS sugar transporter subunit IIA [Hominifimenecus sp. rT4P-3]|uniref:PTS sugar transporter subunit IIA n=1 Tax=Hominifimenecus sp. rT4P-3 TaxID=3242979 RepID=UPI003DA40784